MWTLLAYRLHMTLKILNTWSIPTYRNGTPIEMFTQEKRPDIAFHCTGFVKPWSISTAPFIVTMFGRHSERQSSPWECWPESHHCQWSAASATAKTLLSTFLLDRHHTLFIDHTCIDDMATYYILMRVFDYVYKMSEHNQANEIKQSCWISDHEQLKLGVGL